MEGGIGEEIDIRFEEDTLKNNTVLQGRKSYRKDLERKERKSKEILGNVMSQDPKGYRLLSAEVEKGRKIDILRESD